jgi:transcriptional regulator with XRE-family HTH domain
VLVGPTIRRRRLGSELRRLRELSAMRIEDVASALGVAPSTLSRIETGKAPTRTSYLAIMLDLYGVHDLAERRSLSDLAREGQRKGWWAAAEELLPPGSGSYLGLEAEAAAIDAFAAQIVPGLLQTPDYARSVISASRPDLTAGQAEQLAAVQERRQEVLRGSAPLRLHVVIDESVLLRALAPAVVMKHQLERLAAANARPHVTVRVLRLAGPPVLSGPFSILSFAEPTDADALCATGIRGQLLIEQRPSEVQAMRAVFGALTEAALAPATSSDLINDLARDLG